MGRRGKESKAKDEAREWEVGSDGLKPLSLFHFNIFHPSNNGLRLITESLPSWVLSFVVVYLLFAASSSTMVSLIPLPFGREIIGLLPVPMAKTLVARVANSWPAASLR